MEMKAHLPFQYRSRENAERYNALELFLFAVLYCLKTEFGLKHGLEDWPKH